MEASSLEQQVADLKRAAEQLEAEKETLLKLSEEAKQQPITQLTKEQFEVIYLACKGQQINANTSYGLTLNMNDAKNRLLVRSLARLRIPQISYIDINHIEPDDGDVKGFLANSVPDQLNYLIFNPNKSHQLEGDRFLAGLVSAAAKCKTNFNVYNTDFGGEDFVLLQAAAKHCTSHVYFGNCTIRSDSQLGFRDALDGWKCPSLYLRE